MASQNQCRRPHYEADEETFEADYYKHARYPGNAFRVLGWETAPTEDTEWSGIEERTAACSRSWWEMTTATDATRWIYSR